MAPDTVIKPATLRVMSRTLVFPKTCGTMVDTDFEHLCRQPLGAVDYLAIAKEFDIVFIRGRGLQTPSMFSHTRTITRTCTYTHFHIYPRVIRAHTRIHTRGLAATHTYTQACTPTPTRMHTHLRAQLLERALKIVSFSKLVQAFHE